MKSDVLAAIGEAGLQQPAAVNAALAANDRIKYVFTLLQMAASHADQPEQPAPLLRRERLACGIQDPALDDLPAATSRTGARYHIPGLPALLRRIAADLRLMAAPVAVIDPAIQPRLDALLAALPAAEDETLDPATLAAITQARPDADSLHRLVMDLHRALNALQATLAEERIDGAAAYGLAPEDRPRVAAFMAGLNRTAPLKFDHPGLATSATRQGQRLVVHIEGLAVTVTYTDVHPERLRFFQDMLSGHPVTWTVSQSGQLGGTPFHMATGRLDAADETACRAFLTTLGARLVFLIDWNRARRQLRAFLPGGPRVALLRWAAEQEVGHRGFLALGGAKLVNE
ncbi:MAG: phosphate transport regulator, partial [Rhodospirillales bacterium]|nr:phosphate transport regulator [Rhodospirillales bacterium]